MPTHAEHTKFPAAVHVLETVGVSEQSWSAAARQAVTRAAASHRHITGVDVVRSARVVRDGKIVEYHVTARFAYVPEPARIENGPVPERGRELSMTLTTWAAEPPEVNAPPGACPEVMEVPILLLRAQFLELERTAYAEGITVSRLLRRVIRDYLGRERESSPAVGTPGAG
ncbi:MAG: hypothetical protein JWO38_7883 [Gemmataceae bacterium]|nr:hypothetical protein [Gemmataceae bacterium]